MTESDEILRETISLRDAYGSEPPNLGQRFRMGLHFWWTDHGWLRSFWHNLDQIRPGVWRSNQPSPRRLIQYKRMGIRTVLNLRGTSQHPHYIFEKNMCARLGLKLIDISLRAHALVPRKVMLELLDIFERIERPFVMHCKSGADRAGLASALYMLHMEGMSVDEAKTQLSFRYLHVRRFTTAVLDLVLDAYERDGGTEAMPVRDWIATRYDHKALMAEFAARRGTGTA